MWRKWPPRDRNEKGAGAGRNGFVLWSGADRCLEQLQDDFRGTCLSILSGLGLQVYELIPDYRDSCPLCGGAGCAVRHGLYFRQVVDRDGTLYEHFGVPRFMCRRKGPGKPTAVTFSVLPADLAPRRRWSVTLMLWVGELVLLAGRSIDAVQSELAALSSEVIVDEVAIHRVVRMLAGCYARLLSFPVSGCSVMSGVVSVRDQATEAVRVLTGAGQRDPPAELVLAFHQTWFPNLLLDLPVA